LIPVEIQKDISICLSVAETFAYISNLENMAEWLSTIITARKTSPGETQIGTTISCTGRFMGERNDITFEVIEFEAHHYLTIKSISGVSPTIVYYRFEPNGNGGTNFSQEAIVMVPESMSKLALPILKNAIERQLACDLLALKDLLETTLHTTT